VSAPATTPSTSDEALPPDVIADPAALHLGALGPVGPKVEEVRRIVVLRANGIGDFVVAVPALEALRAAYPDAHITYLGLPWHTELLPGRPGPWDDVAVVPPYPGMIGGGEPDGAVIDAFFEKQQAAAYDLAVQLHGGGGNSNPFVERLGARVTAGARDTGAPPLDRWVRYAYYQHEVLRFLEVVALVGAPPVTIEPRLALTAADVRHGEEALPISPQPLVVLHPGATDPRRRWPPESFARLACALADRGCRVAVVGHGPDDARAASHIAERSDAVDLVGALDMKAIAGVLARARLVIANDSGPRHLGAALGTATVGIYWVGNVINAGPLLRARHRVAVSFRNDCPICGADQSSLGAHRCPHNDSFVADITVDEVLAHADDLLEGAERVVTTEEGARAGG
jgi:ADP-heptose:LPS heptosyltransferase